MSKKSFRLRLTALILCLAVLFCQSALASELYPIEAFPSDESTGIAAASSAQAVTQSSSSSEAGTIKEPEISSQGACLIDANTGQVLYGKNENEQFYPASITKVMTALLVLENCSLDDVVTFSASATTNLESGAVTLNVSEGDQLTVEECLYGLLLKSANEIANGLAEHVSGSVSAFADLMNERARSLGCINTNFVNPNGLTNSSHKTTPYDMCLIMAEALKNPDFRRIDTTLSYTFPAVKNSSSVTISPGHKMLNPSNTSYYYEGIIGGKTGYLSSAGNTLVTGAERDGVRLVCCVMKSSGTHYTDTRALLDYGFENYTALTGRSAGASSQTISSEPSTVNPEGPAASGNVTVTESTPVSESPVSPVISSEPENPAPSENAGVGYDVTVIESDPGEAVSTQAPETTAAEWIEGPEVYKVE